MKADENKDLYRAALVVVGNEILSGRTKDANTSWIAENMTDIGVVLAEVRVVADIEADIVFAVNELRKKFDYVFTTGGIGPTHDDITALAIARAFEVPLILNDEAYNILVHYYGREEDVTPPRKKMAMIPDGADLINNPVSGAPGFQIGNVFVMAGVPRIMQAMFDDVKMRLGRGRPMLSNTIACGLAESVAAFSLEEIQNHYPAVEIGSYPQFRSGILGLCFVLRSIDDALLNQATADVIAMIGRLGGEAKAISIQSSARDLVHTEI